LYYFEMVNATTTTPSQASAAASKAAAASASAKAKAVAAALKVLKQKSHENAAKHFAYGIAGIIALFSIFYCEYRSHTAFPGVHT
jgi:uncharacterized membrane protein